MAIWIEKGELISILERVAEVKEKERELKEGFVNPEPFLPMAVQTAVQLTTGGTGEEEYFDALIVYDANDIDFWQGVEDAKRKGIEPEEIARAIVDLATLKPRAFGDLSKEAIGAFEAALSSKLEICFDELGGS